jgi:hypothetical protein
MQDRRTTDRPADDRRPDHRLSAQELISLAFQGAAAFRLEEMLDRIEGHAGARS